MTNPDKLVVAKRLYHDGQFFPVGTPWPEIDNDPASPVPDKTLQLYQDGGFLVDGAELEKARNREAYEARQAVAAQAGEVAQLQARIAELEAGQAGDSGGDADLKQKLEAAETRIHTLETLLKPEGEGTPLPANFVGRGKLAAFGLDTYESLQGKTSQQLDAIEGITPEQAAKIAEQVTAHFAKGE